MCPFRFIFDKVFLEAHLKNAFREDAANIAEPAEASNKYESFLGKRDEVCIAFETATW